jgi:riboflavin kinase / FMN adenylyltransferase
VRTFIRGLNNLKSRNSAVVATIGNFDGVHLGHQAILTQVKAKAAELSLPGLAMIFEPHPREFFEGGDAPPRLMSLRDKAEAIWAEGIEEVVCLQFNPHLRGMTAREFIESVLVDRMAVRCLIVGDDFRFGCDRAGDIPMLNKAGRRFGFEVQDADTVEYRGERVSSTRIRQALRDDDFELATALLGRPYSISGKVIHGQKIGRQIGVPTANISLRDRNLPVRGVFVAWVHTGQTRLPAVVNVGSRPTLGGEMLQLLEAHVLGWQGDIYGQRIRVEFLEKIRSEQRFDGIDALQQQIQRDRHYAGSYFAREA